jgi:hypothetical protein
LIKAAKDCLKVRVMVAISLVILLGLFPAFFLPVLQMMMLLVLGELLWRRRSIAKTDVQNILIWTNIAVLQFVVFFLLNVIFFGPLQGARSEYRLPALESWSGSLVCALLLMLWLQLQDPVKLKTVLMQWLPLGLAISFCVATYIYLFHSDPGERIRIFTPNPLIPPLWFLSFTLVSFCWASEMTTSQKTIRIILFLMAGIMAVYTGARLILVAWIVSALLLGIYAVILAQAQARLRLSIRLIFFGCVVLLAVLLVDYFARGIMMERFISLIEVRSDPTRWAQELPRLLLWPAAWSIIQENWMFGIGQLNERLALQERLEWGHWFRAHQAYLSYLIAGGVPALISGLVFQAPILSLLRRAQFRAMFPAFIGLGVVLTMNAFTDSVFQSSVGVQVYMAASLMTLRAALA